jgi:hypothetical protein
MLGIDFLIWFGIGMLISSACVMILYHFAENDISRLSYKLKHGI